MGEEETIWELEPHTAAKHAILRRYLEAWIAILGQARWNAPDRLVLVDACAGPGIYKDGEPGSPIIMLNAYLKHTLRANIKPKLVYLFIEQDKDRFDALRENVAKLELPEKDKLEIIAVHGTFEDEFGGILDDIEDRGAQLAPTFAFIDPFGYKDAPMAVNERFLQFDRCEVLIYVPLPWLNRFLTSRQHAAANTSFYGGEEWRDAIALEPAERVPFLRALFKRKLETVGNLHYVRSFEIESHGNARGYDLVYGTRSLVGLEQMKRSMWKVDQLAGARFRDVTDPNALVLFEEEVDTTPLKHLLREHFDLKPFSIEEAERFVLVDTPYVPSMHLKMKTLKPLEKEDGILEALTARKSRWTYPPHTVLRFTQ